MPTDPTRAALLDHPDRLLRLRGASNFRDLGGYPGRGGSPVRWRRLFRSDHLAALDETDRAALAALGIGLALDFRGVGERAAASYALPGIVQHALPIEPTVSIRLQQRIAAGEPLDARIAADLMVDLYREFVDAQAHRYADFFGHLLAADAPLVFHCTAGKDRTGFAAALLLLALGVPQDWVEQDYLLTNAVFAPPVFADDDPTADAMRVLWRVDARFLSAALLAIERDQGGIDAYLSRRLGLGERERAALAARYLQAG